jgi:hypothetical protein
MTWKIKKKQKSHHDLIFYGDLDTFGQPNFPLVIAIYQFSQNKALRGRLFGHSLSSVSKNKATRVFLLRSVYEREYEVQHQPRQDTALDQTNCDASFWQGALLSWETQFTLVHGRPKKDKISSLVLALGKCIYHMYKDSNQITKNFTVLELILYRNMSQGTR